MSPLQVTVLGAIAGLTIFLGLPFGRLQRPTVRLKAGLNAVAIGVLLFLGWDILTHGWEPVDAALSNHELGTAVVDGLVLFAGIAVGCVGLVYYDQKVTRSNRRPVSIGAVPAPSGTAIPAAVPDVAAPGVAADGGRSASAVDGRQLAMLIAVGIGGSSQLRV